MARQRAWTSADLEHSVVRSDVGRVDNAGKQLRITEITLVSSPRWIQSGCSEPRKDAHTSHDATAC